ncbi:transcriptional corepressor LEUNIG_HOMOLOG-like isoform X1 [Papaver somniferum]|uniref:transcriptional corepressor LEUNIG_HOMOLOG-like isoform X1 n=1 Tax=Papaver somniferum TaxID=3469 RepID=UPI000E6F933A|nr:transcriptional corepressor LEUNIG_HOMOLOG-like isoform X1 [Papaver somniferum]XP_026457645.1 transcriptional corepressor LEUNIG_HOMOLOG-like isoform X1 [Papaver somniferum]
MAQSNWEADKMLDVYIYDYLLKRNLHASAKAFMTEGKVAADPVAIDAPGGFLFEWWSVFWDIFIARTNEKHSEVAAAYIETQQIKAREHQQQLHMQQLQLMQQRHAQLQRRDGNHPSIGGPVNAINSEGMLGQSTASVLAAKMYEERMKHPHSMDSETSPQLIDASRMALLKSATNHPGQLVQGNPGSVSAALQQIQARTQQTTDIKGEINLGVNQRSLPMDPSSIYGQGSMQSKSGLGGAGLNQGASGLPLKGWPLTNQIIPGSLGSQVQKTPFIQAPNQFQLLTPHQQQQLLAQAQAQGNLGSSQNYGDMDSRRYRVLPRGNMNSKDSQPTGNDGSIGSPMQASSPKVRLSSQDQADYLMKMKMTHMQQSSSQQLTDQLQPQQLQQNNRKRKQTTSSGPANSTGTGNTVGPSNSQPSTPSTHTPGDGVPMAANLQHVNSMPKSLMMYGPDGTGGLASSSNQLEDMELGSLDDNVESFLSQDDGDGRDLFGTLKRSPIEHNTESSKGFSFSEVGCIRTSNSKVGCCHFSSDGKLLASAGHERKAVLWNMDTLQTESAPEEHTLLISDIRFRPNSTQFATSSFDRSIRLWNAADPTYSLGQYTGHSANVTSLDFHPKKTEIFCSCDANGEIRYWNINQSACSRVSKGATEQVRFQPRIGHLLAAAAERVVSIYDVETDRQTHALQGHSGPVRSICWDANGDYLASVSEDSVRVWSLNSGECIHELSSNGNKFHSSVFHPSYSTLLVVGGYQTLELWNMAENKSMTIPAHEGQIAALAQSPVTGMVASASHDKSVKLWK